MRKSIIYMHGVEAGILSESEDRTCYRFSYLPKYQGPPVSLNLLVQTEPFEFSEFPPFFDGLLPEGLQLEALLREAKIDRQDNFSQLLCVGSDLVGAVTVQRFEKGIIE